MFFAILHIRKVSNKRWSVMNGISMNSVSFKGVQENKEPEKKISAADVEQKADEFTKTVDAASEGVKKTAESVTGAMATVTGSMAMIRKSVSNLIPTPVKDFFAPKQPKLDASGHILLDENKNEIFQRIANWKHIGIVAGVAATVAAGIAIYKGVKGHIEHKRELELKNAQNALKAEEAKPKEEIAEQKTEEIPDTEE